MSDTQTADRSPTETLLRDLYAMAEFLTANAAVLKDTRVPTVGVTVAAASREQLDELAEHFGESVYQSETDPGCAQFSVRVPGTVGYAQVIFSWGRW